MGILDALKRRREEESAVRTQELSTEPSIVTVAHHGSAIGLRREFAERYVILHRNVFPGVLARIRESNIRNYSIFLGGGRLFAHYEYIGKDYPGDMAAMGDPITKDWWKLTDPMQSPIRGRKKGEWWAAATLLGHFGGDVHTGGNNVRGCLRTVSGVRAGERGKRILDAHRPAISVVLRRYGFRNVGVYHVGGWIHCYFEHSAPDLSAASNALVSTEEFRSVMEEFRGLVHGGGKKGNALLWESMSEVFHTD